MILKKKMKLRVISVVYFTFSLFLISCSSLKKSDRIKIPFLLDTDPALGIFKKGNPRDVDDGLAIIESINSNSLDLQGITIVFGNSEMNQGFDVASKLVKLKNSVVPVKKGAAGAIESGVKIPITDATRFLAKKLRSGRFTIAAIGPLTNIASLVRNFPEESKNIDKIIVVMGRSIDQHFYIGTFGPVRDFNYVKDPLAAQIVIKSGIPMVMAPFELSSRALITSKHLKNIQGHRTDSAQFLFEKSQAWLNFWYKNFPHENGFHPWDSAAIAYITHPNASALKMGRTKTIDHRATFKAISSQVEGLDFHYRSPQA